MELWFKNHKEWRKWLEKNGSTAKSLWIIMYKKHTGRECILYEEALEEALCFGWIDGKIKRVNDEYYIQFYTPRRPGSRWSNYNIERVERLKKEGRMAEAGLEAYNMIFKNPNLAYNSKRSGNPEIPEELLIALKENKAAFNNFMNFPPSARRMYIEWYKFARQDKTRQVRAEKIIRFSEENQRPGML